MIKLLIFDAGDLLWKISRKDLEKHMNEFFKKYKIDGNLINSRWDKIKPNAETGKIKYKKAVEIQFKGLNINKKVLKEWSNLHLKLGPVRKKLNPYVKPILKKLKKKYKIVILTDDVKSCRHKNLICKQLGIDNIFDQIFCSYDIGYSKPHRKAFFTVLNNFKVKSNEAIFIGHSKDEIEGARKLKIKTIAINWDRGTKSDFYVKRFSEIPKILEKIK